MGIAHQAVERLSAVLDAKSARASKADGTSVMAECVEVDENGVPWVRILGSESATPATTRLATAQKGDLVTMSIRDGKAELNGNLTSPSVGTSQLATVEDAAEKAKALAGSAESSARSALASAETAQAAAGSAQESAAQANEYAQGALEGLSTVEDVVGVLNWAAENATFTLTTDTSIVPGKVYWTRSGSSPNYTYTPVANPSEASLSTYYEVSGMDEAMADYVSSHLALTDDGLYVMQDSSGYRLKINSSGWYIIDPNGVTVNQATGSGNDVGPTSGRHIHVGSSSIDMMNGANVDGWSIGSAIELLKGGTSYIWAGLQSSIATVRIGLSTAGNIILSGEGYASIKNGSDVIARFGSFETSGGYSRLEETHICVNISQGDRNGVGFTVGASCDVFVTATRNGVTDTDVLVPSSNKYTVFFNQASVGDEVEITYDTLEILSSGYIGKNIRGVGANAFATGRYTKASGADSHAEGNNTEAIGSSSHAEGGGCTSIGSMSHAEGYSSNANGSMSHAEGRASIASGQVSHAEGSGTTASGTCSHAEGSGTVASGDYSHAHGNNTLASYYCQTAIGKYNVANPAHAFIIGNGTADNARSNAFSVDWNGGMYDAGEQFYPTFITSAHGSYTPPVSPCLVLDSTEGKLYKYASRAYTLIVATPASHNHSGDALTPASVTATGAIKGSSISDGTGTLAQLRESVSNLIVTELHGHSPAIEQNHVKLVVAMRLSTSFGSMFLVSRDSSNLVTLSPIVDNPNLSYTVNQTTGEMQFKYSGSPNWVVTSTLVF